MSDDTEISGLSRRCEICRDDVRSQITAFDRRLLALEIIVRGEDGRNGMKAQLTELCHRFDSFEKKAIRWIAVGTSLPGIVVAVVAALKFVGRL
jgi:hypothetical protein